MINNIKNMIKNYSREIECHAIIKNNLENNQSKTQENLINIEMQKNYIKIKMEIIAELKKYYIFNIKLWEIWFLFQNMLYENKKNAEFRSIILFLNLK